VTDEVDGDQTRADGLNRAVEVWDSGGGAQRTADHVQAAASRPHTEVPSAIAGRSMPMSQIRNEHQRQAALSWIEYWRTSVRAGDQSWLAGEQALDEIMTLHRGIDAYDRRTASAAAGDKSEAFHVARRSL